ncbi:mechanosensitive ion channel family protein [Pontibacter liquoris]|uniref:mechanosensitive ion channel family protein n=1 Tax=Pontibacter liquoris TaxID=2905677 RepID=UPI001FA72803|nr:mechanosensitive ion channel family protein [Pontibacter liquoris]
MVFTKPALPLTPFLKKQFYTSRLLFLLCTCWLLASIPASVQAQEQTADTAEKALEVLQPNWSPDSLGRRSPRGTVDGFLEAVADENYQRAALYLHLDTTLQEHQDGARLARGLQLLLDQGGSIIPLSFLSNEPEGRTDDNLGPTLDRVGKGSINGESFDVFVERTEAADGAPIWLFSSQTIQRIPVHTAVAAAPIANKVLPSVLEENKWGGVPVGHWLGMLVLAVLAYALAWIITWALTRTIRYVWHKSRKDPTAGIVEAFALPIRLYLATWILVVTSQKIGISIIVRQRFSELTIIVGLVALLLLLWQLVDVISRFSERQLVRRGNVSGVSVVLFLRRGAKVGLIVIGVISILATLGVDVTAGLAALGIGGIALALGAQKTVENFVGSVTLIADQPIRIGDYCKVGETSGTVEQIGMRSTRIRTNQRTVVTIPNGDFSSQRIENFAPRDRFWFNPILRLRYDTTPAQIRSLLKALRALLVAHPKVDDSTARVRMIEIGKDSLNIELYAYVQTTDNNEYLEIQESLFLDMMDAVEACGSGLALPSQSLYLARDNPASNGQALGRERQAETGND